MIEPINKVTCDWCGKFELTNTNAIPKEFFLVRISHSSGETELFDGAEVPEVENFLLCTACRNSVESVKNLRMKERRENKASQTTSLHWPATESNHFVRDRVCA